MADRTFILAIDGPAGAGKSSIAGAVARRLGMTRVDTGAIYRCLTLLALERGLSDDLIPGLLGDLQLHFEGDRVFLGSREVTTAIRTAEVSHETSRVSALPAVRAGLLELQRRLGREAAGGAVMEGRDIGTVVFPNADLKVFLTASAEERARRRLLDLEEAGARLSFDEVLQSIEARDHNDSQRAHAPLRQPEDAIRVDSTGKSPDEVVDEIVALVERRRGR
jgi:cytidylate kinase